MPITADTILAGMQVPKAFMKAGITMAAVGAMRGYNPRYAAGNPGASTAPSAGINGAGVSGSSNGGIPRANPGGALSSYLARLSMNPNVGGSLWLIDRLWENSGLSVTSTGAQAITPATVPSRDAAASANGAQVMAAIEWSATGGAGTPTVTLTYTDQDGNTGQSATFAGVTTPPVGTFEIFQLAAGDTGVRAPTSFIQSATRTSGTMHLVLFRVLAQMECIANMGAALDALTGGRPQILDDAHLSVIWFPSATTAINFNGTYIETQLDPA
jgi:hypothetical protein